jgi:hypothetical protein
LFTFAQPKGPDCDPGNIYGIEETIKTSFGEYQAAVVPWLVALGKAGWGFFMIKTHLNVAIVPRDLAESRVVSLAAKGLYTLMQMQNFVSIAHLAERNGIERGYAEELFEELLKCGYVDIVWDEGEKVFIINP